MTVDRRWVYGGLLAAGAVGVAKLVGSGPRLSPGHERILVIGDSMALGLAPFLRALAREQGVTFDSQALRDTRIDQWAGSRKLDEKLVSFKPTMVLVSLGTNDEYLGPQIGGVVPAASRPFLNQLLAKLQKAGAEVVWIGPPTLPKAQSNGIVAMIQSSVPRSHYFFTEQLDIPRAPDRLHPNTRGYAGWAGAIWQWLS